MSSDASPIEDALEEIRDHILSAEGFPLSGEQRERLREYDVRLAMPDERAVNVEVEVEVHGEEADSDAPSELPQRRLQNVEITPTVVAESPSGLRFFAGWNHVAELLVVWCTDGSLEALEREVGPVDADRVRPPGVGEA